MTKKVLMILTNTSQLNKDNPTGLWLSEFTEPYALFKKKGYEISVASPLGGRVPLDPKSITEERPPEWNEAVARLDNTEQLNGIVFEGYDAVFLPGGHGAMFDLPKSNDLQNILAFFAKDNRVIGAVCHGPAAFANAIMPDGSFLVEGKKLTAFTNKEEEEMGLASDMPYLLQSKLAELGAGFVEAAPFTDHVVTDGKLVTGQNPQSAESTAAAVIKLLEQK